MKTGSRNIEPGISWVPMTARPKGLAPRKRKRARA